MKCPHCQQAFHDHRTKLNIGEDIDGYWNVLHQVCPACKRIIIELTKSNDSSMGLGRQEVNRSLVHPKGAQRPLPPKEVHPDFATDYIEASLILSDSPKASAALSRRCLQHIIRVKAGIKKKDLAEEIQAVIDSKTLPSHLSEAIDAIRNIGNFAAHPIKATASGEILDVEPGEAEWTLDVLDGLFDFYFVQPEKLKEKRAELNAKLASAGKPPLK